MTQLKDTMDITDFITDTIDLDIQGLSSLSKQLRKFWKPVEEKVKRDYKAPNLPAYLLYEYHFNYQSLNDLSPKLGVSISPLYNIMRRLGIPTRTLQAPRIMLEKKVRQVYGMSLHDYLLCEYHFNHRGSRDLAAKLGRSYQTILNIMHSLGIPTRDQYEWTSEMKKQISERFSGKTWEEIYGSKTAQRLRRQRRRKRKKN